MRTKWIMAAIASIWTCFAFAQENLVPNGGFEEGRPPQCREHYSSGKDVFDERRHAVAFDTDLDYWKRAKPKDIRLSVTSPDYFDSLVTTQCDDNNCAGFRRYTPRYVGLWETEGVRNSLIQPLQPDKKYHVRFLLRSTGTGRVLISKYGEHWYRNAGNDRFQFGQIQDYPNTTCNWIIAQMSLTIPSDKTGLQNLVFTGDGSKYFAIDDVELFEACPDTMHIQDRRYHPLPFPEPEEAGHIRVGYRVTNARIPGDVIVREGSVIQYKGAEEVSLEDGFYVEKGGDFRAYIAPCGMRCPPFNIDGDMDTVICSPTPFVIAGQSSPNGIYQWTARNPLDLAYLENTNTYAPTFVPPLTGAGFIQYTLKVTNACGEHYYRNVNIKYDMASGSTPGFSLLDSSLTDSLAFTLKLDGHTEKAKIELLTCSYPPQVIQEYEYSAFEDFSTDTLRWTLLDEVNLCQCYDVRISTKNFCSQLWYSRVVSWPLIPRSSYNINLPNAISDNDGCQYCFHVKGAQSYSMTVLNRYGQTVQGMAGAVTSQEVCTWDASGIPFGEYYATLNVVDCDGQTHSYNITILVACSSNMTTFNQAGGLPVMHMQTTDSLKYQTALVTPNVLHTYVVPNPIDQNPEIVYQLPEEGNVSLRIYTADGRMVEVLEDNQRRDAGIYKINFDARLLGHGISYYQLNFTNTRGEYQSKHIRFVK